MSVSTSSRRTRLASLIVANLLLPIAVLVFAFGFFPYKPVLPGLSDFEDDQDAPSGGGLEENAPFDKVIFMVVDALRSDFVFGHESAMQYVQRYVGSNHLDVSFGRLAFSYEELILIQLITSLIRDGSAIPFTAHASPPTVTMPRVKALTTGSVPSFLDLILNFAESDTSSSLAAQDTWLAQLRRRGHANGKEKVVFYGDDTWLKLFPGDFFGRSEGTSSFFVSDFTQVDNNVTRHLPAELKRPDWNALIMHYLGLDHIGHKTGPQGPAMLPKQREMDDIFRMLYDSVQREEHLKNTLVVLVGDHGMNAGGNHGGSGPGETEPALVFASPKFSGIQPRTCPTNPKEGTEFEFYRKVQQSDVVPTLAGLMGFPVPKNSLGVVLEEIAQSLPGKDDGWVWLLRRNARQILGILEASMGTDKWMSSVTFYKNHKMSCGNVNGENEEMACMWAKASALHSLSGEADALLQFLHKAQDALSSTASSYELPRMVMGIAIASMSSLLATLAFPSLWPPSLAGSTLTITTLLYGIMMFASSYVEEEQHFWYWITPAWLALLAMRSAQQNGTISLQNGLKVPRALLVLPIMACHRVMVRWNQTGQKHAGEPDIVHGFFPSHHMLMWGLIITAYIVVGVQVARVSFKGVMPSEAAFSTAFVMILPAIVFKLNFTQADAPELVLGLGSKIRAATAGLDLVTQARVVFTILFLASAIVAVGLKWFGGKSNAQVTPTTLADRFHVLLTLFLITQTRAPNVPLFLLLEVQRFSFARLLPQLINSGNNLQTLPIALTSLLLSQTTYFAFGGSNSISSIDLSNAYNGVADYNIVAVGVLLFAGNWAGAIWWCSAAVTLLRSKPIPELTTVQPQRSNASRPWIEQERAKLRTDALASLQSDASGVESVNTFNSWTLYITATTVFTAGSLVAVMAACTLLRTHLFIWTVFSPKYLYAMAWAVGWHLVICVGLGRLLYALGGIF